MYEKRHCPHCKSELQVQDTGPETGWGDLLVCANNACPYFRESADCIESQGGSKRGYRYAEDPGRNYEPVALVCWVNERMLETCARQ